MMKPHTLWLHASLVLILAGAIVTHFCGEVGSLHLRRYKEAGAFVREDGTEAPLPFSVKLESFKISYYTGTTTPKDYSSKLIILPDGVKATISMNHVLRKNGYRFLQADYDNDRYGSILMVCHDPWGTGITFAGYILLLAAMVAYFFRKNSSFRAAVRRLPSVPARLRASLLVLLLLLLGGCFFLICRKLFFEPLMPVLRSPLLWIHVAFMIICYTLFALMAVNGVAGLSLKDESRRVMLQDLNLVILYPAVFLLAAGIIVGAYWASISWGRYWSWDPKETWALITLLIYAIGLHRAFLKPFRNPRFFHAFCIAAFLFVLVTWFGVNLFMGGMHSYA